MHEVTLDSLPDDTTNDIGMFGQTIEEDDIDLTAMEREWDKQGKTAEQKKSLRYYYRNRNKISRKLKNNGYDGYEDGIEKTEDFGNIIY